MKKGLLIALTTVFLLTGCSELDKEKIGSEYMALDEIKEITKESRKEHGFVMNHKQSYQNNIWTNRFDYMNATSVQEISIKEGNTLEVTSKFLKGEVWLKITQGDIAKSKIQKVQLQNNTTSTIDLSQWEEGEINLWLVATESENAFIEIKNKENPKVETDEETETETEIK